MLPLFMQRLDGLKSRLDILQHIIFGFVVSRSKSLIYLMFIASFMAGLSSITSMLSNNERAK